MKDRIKLAIVFIIGLMISAVISVYATAVISASEVSYTDNKSIGSSNVSGALDILYTKNNTLTSNVSTLQSDFNTGVIKAEKVESTITRTLGSSARLTAPTVNGYTFVSWSSCYTTGWAGFIVIGDPLRGSDTAWVTNVSYSNAASGTFGCIALYRKNK